PRQHNLTLSQNRSHSIKDYLVGHGIDATRLTAEGYGQARPIEPNTTASGRLANRRVQFQIVRASWEEPPPPQTEVHPHPHPRPPPAAPGPTQPCRVP